MSDSSEQVVTLALVSQPLSKRQIIHTQIGSLNFEDDRNLNTIHNAEESLTFSKDSKEDLQPHFLLSKILTSDN
jgi:hypothetical protein